MSATKDWILAFDKILSGQELIISSKKTNARDADVPDLAMIPSQAVEYLLDSALSTGRSLFTTSPEVFDSFVKLTKLTNNDQLPVVPVEGRTILHRLINLCPDDAKTVSWLLENDSTLIDTCDVNGQTPLHYAVSNMRERFAWGNNWTMSFRFRGSAEAEEQRYEVVRMLIQAGANIESRDANGCTPLLHAVTFGDVEKVSLIIQAGANLEVVDDKGDSCLHAAISVFMDEESAGESNKKSDAHRSQMIRVLLRAGAPVQVLNRSGCSPLHCAIELCDVRIIEQLIDAGADVNAVNDQNLTALHLIVDTDFNNDVFARDSHIIRKLMLAGAAIEFDSAASQSIRWKDGLQEYIKSCSSELRLMENTNLVASGYTVSYYRIIKYENALDRIKDLPAIESLERQNLLKKFPIYGKCLRKVLSRVLHRRKLEANALQGVNQILWFDKLILEQIIRYLNNADLENLSDLYEGESILSSVFVSEL